MKRVRSEETLVDTKEDGLIIEENNSTTLTKETEQDRKVEKKLQQRNQKKKPNKRRKKSKKNGRPCHSWALNGECEYGETCKYTHDLAAKGQGLDPTSYGAPWPESRNPFGDVVARNYTELLLKRNSCTLSSISPTRSSTSSMYSSTTSLSTTLPTTKDETITGNAPCLDQYVHYHPNHLCIVGIAPNHAVLNSNSPISKVTYRSNGSGVNMLDIKMSGKKKSGSLKVHKNTVLCDILLENGKSYEIVAGMDGSLIEVNKRIVENPKLLVNDPRYRGYIGIIFQQKDKILKRDLGRLINVSITES
jgi:hypothetical protein